jgi:hypothetical protein
VPLEEELQQEQEIPFVMFRMASAEEILFQPRKACENSTTQLPLVAEEDLEMKRFLETIEQKTTFNPFDYESGALDHFLHEFQSKSRSNQAPLQLIQRTSTKSKIQKKTIPVNTTSATAPGTKRGKKNTRRFL